MSMLFDSVTDIYMLIGRFTDGSFNQRYSRDRFENRRQVESIPLSNQLESGDALMVVRMQYASPGFVDLAGLGEITKSLVELIKFLVTTIVERKAREQSRRLTDLQLQAAVYENQARQLDLLEKAINLAERRDLTSTARKQILNSLTDHQLNVARFINDEKLNKIEDVQDSN